MKIHLHFEGDDAENREDIETYIRAYDYKGSLQDIYNRVRGRLKHESPSAEEALFLEEILDMMVNPWG